jgi:hypothetical protein
VESDSGIEGAAASANVAAVEKVEQLQKHFETVRNLASSYDTPKMRAVVTSVTGRER